MGEGGQWSADEGRHQDLRWVCGETSVLARGQFSFSSFVQLCGTQVELARLSELLIETREMQNPINPSSPTSHYSGFQRKLYFEMIQENEELCSIAHTWTSIDPAAGVHDTV